MLCWIKKNNPMPELPEVETISRYLRHGRGDQPSILERRILAVHLLWERTLADPAPPEFLARLPGQTIRSIGRRGKHLLLHLDQGTLIVHLRMSGDMLVVPAEREFGPHDRLVLDLEGGWRLVFQDARKFGRVWLAASVPETLHRLGPEPLDDEFTPEWLVENLARRKRLLKPLLLDQTFIAGLGNIYTDEALHRARLHPLLRSDQVTPPQAYALWESIRQVLQEGIRRQGASIDWVYRGGDFQNQLQVYRRTGAPCPTCSAPIVRAVVGQRSTHYCPHCQPEPPA
jgi:formamidopyrimidine-DNA glycosylase